MGLAENPLGWVRVNGAAETKGLSCIGPIPQASPPPSGVKRRGTVPGVMLGEVVLLGKVSALFSSLCSIT